MKIFCKFPTVNISKLNFWLVICIAKNFIWTNLKVIFSIFGFFLHPQIPDFQIVVSQPNIVLLYKYCHICSAVRWLVLWFRVTFIIFVSVKQLRCVMVLWKPYDFCTVPFDQFNSTLLNKSIIIIIFFLKRTPTFSIYYDYSFLYLFIFRL